MPGRSCPARAWAAGHGRHICPVRLGQSRVPVLRPYRLASCGNNSQPISHPTERYGRPIGRPWRPECGVIPATTLTADPAISTDSPRSHRCNSRRRRPQPSDPILAWATAKRRPRKAKPLNLFRYCRRSAAPPQESEAPYPFVPLLFSWLLSPARAARTRHPRYTCHRRIERQPSPNTPCATVPPAVPVAVTIRAHPCSSLAKPLPWPSCPLSLLGLLAIFICRSSHASGPSPRYARPLPIH